MQQDHNLQQNQDLEKKLEQDLPENPLANNMQVDLPTPAERITELEAALEEAKASVLYVKAEGENIRRRAFDDIDKARKFALEKFSNELLAVKDSLDAALNVGIADVESYKNGVEITSKQLSAVFEKFNIAEINPIGEKFDPHKHQAISMLENSGEPNTVTSVLQKSRSIRFPAP